MTTTKDLIERARFQSSVSGHWQASQAELADALERLTQPVGVDPVLQVWIEGNPGVWEDCSDWAYQQAADDDRRTLYSADAVARLQAEGAAMSADISGISDERDVLQEQVNVLRDALNEAALVISHFETSCDADSETLPMVMEALAATENKEPKS